MAGVNDNSREGSRNRSFSESDSVRISDLTFHPTIIDNLNPDIGCEDDSRVFQSNPDLSSLNDDYIESPMWSGRGTRLQRRQAPIINEKYEKALKDCLALTKDINKWFETSDDSEDDNPDKLYEAIEIYKRRIARASQEGLIRLVDKSVLDQLASNQIRLENLRKRLDKEDRQRLNPSISASIIPLSTNADDEFNPIRASTSSENPPDLPSNPIPPISTIEPEPEKIHPPPADVDITVNSNPDSSPNDTPPSQSDILSEIQSALDNEVRSLINRERVGISSRFDFLEAEQRALKIDQSECRTKIDSTIQLLEKLETDSELTSSRLDSLEARVDLIDTNLKSYVDSHVRKVNKKIDESRIGQDKDDLNMFISNNVKNVLNSSAPATEVRELVKEIEAIKHQSQCDNMLIENMRTVVSEVKDQLDKSLDRSVNTSTSNISIEPVDNRRKDRERDLTRNAIEGSARLIRQLTLVKINEFSEVGLIRKCNQDVRKITGYIKTCQDLLMKYLSYDGMDGEYYQSIETLLNNANDWIIGVFTLSLKFIQALIQKEMSAWSEYSPIMLTKPFMNLWNYLR